MIEREANLCRLSGDATLETVPDLLEKLRPLVQEGVDTLDCAAIKNVDSSALGLILACKREAASRQKNLKVTGLPQSLLSLASLYGIADQL
jgi:phospholipid transport system transporter-binding protein